MIRPPGFEGTVFSTAADGDLRNDLPARHTFAGRLGITGRWATATQVHGSRVVVASQPGDHGPADGLVTSRASLPIAVFTADCVGVIAEAPTAVGVAHAGWRGLAAGAVAELIEVMRAEGHGPERAAIGPSIGPCCYEVGDEVTAALPGFAATTTWGTASVDLWGAAAAQLDGLDLWTAAACTRCGDDYLSFRRTGTTERMGAVAWLK